MKNLAALCRFENAVHRLSRMEAIGRNTVGGDALDMQDAIDREQRVARREVNEARDVLMRLLKETP